ncbi:MAG TPA: JDVT-CTERM system glutamic-type intramembrane protease [Burkholderiales bacterium]|nr:JDVT-CTERM system glutamic-type intramembrane protease [Burkholderiales bacterium]
MHAPSISRLVHDRHFVAALAAGPVACVALALALNVQPSPAWILGDPARALSLVVAWPLLEETLFRGGVQPALLRTRWGAREAWGLTTANVATSVLFAAAHLASQTPEWAAAAFVPSLVFGHFRERYGSIVPGAALHVFYNAGYFLLVAPRPPAA